MSRISRFKIKSGDIVDIYAYSASTAESAYTADVANSVNGVGLNGKGNLEISNRADSTISGPIIDAEDGSKINLASKGAIQIKPGLTKKGKSAAIAFDNEYNTVSPTQVELQSTNGSSGFSYSDKIVGTKWNTAEMVLDTKGAWEDSTNEDAYDVNEFNVKFRNDSWNKGVAVEDTNGPIYAKFKARAFDFRCHDHGGIALQIAGQDSDGHENKIKFESDRISASTQAYCGEGGKGFEFGTFNNLHTSLYTEDYRFKGDAKVYAASRRIETTDDKTDYVTQGDDFKDVISDTSAATWNEIIKVATDYKNGLIGQGGSSSSETPSDAVSKVDFVAYTGATETKINAISANSIAISSKVTALEESPANHYVTCDGEKVVVDATSIITGYEYGDGTSGATSSKTISEEVVVESGDTSATTVVETTYSGSPINGAKVNLKSNRKISLKGQTGIELETESLIFPLEVSKKNKLSCGDYEVEGLTSYEEFVNATPKIGFVLEKNNSTISEIAALGTTEVSISIVDLLNMKTRLDALEAKVAALESGSTQN